MSILWVCAERRERNVDRQRRRGVLARGANCLFDDVTPERPGRSADRQTVEKWPNFSQQSHRFPRAGHFVS